MKLWGSIIGTLSISCSFILAPGVRGSIAPASTVPTSTITAVTAFGTMPNMATVYVAGPSGLYRSSSPTYSQWTRQSPITTISAISPNPGDPNDLVYSAGEHIYRSTDGGRSAVAVQCGSASFARSPTSPSIIYADYESCPTDTSTFGPGISKSTDDGRTWKNLYFYTSPSSESSSEGIDLVIVNPTNPSDVVAGEIEGHGYGRVLVSLDGGHTWNTGEDTPLDYSYPSAIGFNPADPTFLWIDWTGYLEYNGEQITAGLPQSPNYTPCAAVCAGTPSTRTPQVVAFRYDPLTKRVYLNTQPSQSPSQIYAFGPENQFEPFFTPFGNDTILFEITRNGYLLAGGARTPLVVTPLIGSGHWPLSPLFTRYNATYNVARLLGRPLSPTTRCGKYLCQYFDKGRLENHGAKHGSEALRVAYGSLVPDLIAARADLSVGGSASTLTYKMLYSLAAPSRRVAPPAHFTGGTMPVPGGRFIPWSERLASAPGYVVPTYFWSYMTQRATMPGGWLHDLGLPLAPAVAATVIKGKLERRQIEVQSFQYGILTYDPRNAALFRVERANVGVDYAATFPGAVR